MQKEKAQALLNGTDQNSDGDYWSDMDYSDSDDENRRQNKNSPHKKKVTRKCHCLVFFMKKI